MGCTYSSFKLERFKEAYVPGYHKEVHGIELEDRYGKVKPFHPWGVTLDVIDNFITNCGGAQALKKLTTREVCNKFMIPQMKEKFLFKKENSERIGGSYANYVKTVEGTDDAKGVDEADIYVVHAWDANFINMVEALRYSVEEQNPDNVHTMHFWIDIFCHNQCKVYVHSEEWYRRSLKEEISKWVKQTIIVLSPWDDPILFKRSWCLMETYFAIHDVEIKKFREEEDKKGRARRGSIDFSNPSTATSNTNIFAQSEKVIVAMTRGEKKLFVDAVHEDSPTTIPYKFFRLVNNISISDSQARCQEQRKIILKLFKAKPDKTWREQVDYVPASQLRMSGVHGSSKSSKSSKSSSSYKSSKSTRESSKGQENAGADVVYSRKNKVEVNYKGRGRWYSGTVTGKHTSSKTGNTTYTIKFDDGNLDHHFLEDESLMERNYDMVKESEFNNTVRGFFIENVVDQARICITDAEKNNDVDGDGVSDGPDQFHSVIQARVSLSNIYRFLGRSAESLDQLAVVEGVLDTDKTHDIIHKFLNISPQSQIMVRSVKKSKGSSKSSKSPKPLHRNRVLQRGSFFGNSNTTKEEHDNTDNNDHLEDIIRVSFLVGNNHRLRATTFDNDEDIAEVLAAQRRGKGSKSESQGSGSSENKRINSDINNLGVEEESKIIVKLDAAGHYLEAQNCYLQCLMLCIIKDGLDSPHTWEMINSLALVLNNQERIYDELKLYKDFLEIYEDKLGKKHYYTASLRNNMGNLLTVLSRSRNFNQSNKRRSIRSCRSSLTDAEKIKNYNDVEKINEQKYNQFPEEQKRAHQLNLASIHPDAHEWQVKWAEYYRKLMLIVNKKCETEVIKVDPVVMKVDPEVNDWLMKWDKFTKYRYENAYKVKQEGVHKEKNLLMNDATHYMNKTYDDRSSSMPGDAQMDPSTLYQVTALATLALDKCDYAHANDLCDQHHVRLSVLYDEAKNDGFSRTSVDVGERALIMSYMLKNTASFKSLLYENGLSVHDLENPEGPVVEELLVLEENCVKCLNKCTNNLGTNHPDTLSSRDLLLSLWRARKRFGRIDTYMKKVDESKRKMHIPQIHVHCISQDEEEDSDVLKNMFTLEMPVGREEMQLCETIEGSEILMRTEVPKIPSLFLITQDISTMQSSPPPNPNKRKKSGKSGKKSEKKKMNNNNNNNNK